MKRCALFVVALPIAIVTFLSGKAVGQSNPYCGFDVSQQVPLTQTGGYQITSTGTVKALLIFIDFPDDAVDPNNSTWPVGVGPNYLNQIVDETETQNSGLKNNITTFFRKMSFSQFTMIGKSYYVQAPQPLSWYQTNHNLSEAAFAAQDAIQLLDQQVDFADFDRWTYNGPFNHTPSPDGKLDMVFVCFRRWYICPGVLFGCSFIAEGWYGASLPNNSVNVDRNRRQIVSAQAVDVLQMIQYPRLEHLEHEFGHVWGLPHNYSGGLWSLMGHRHPNVSSFMNSYEREQLGWINFNNVTVDGTTATISDFATTGVAYRIAIPSTNESFLIENHQQIALYDTVDISANTGPGLYILQRSSGNELRVASADGKWNWSNPYWIQNLFNPTNPLDSIPVFKRGVINRSSGQTDKVEHLTTKVDQYGNPIYYLTFAWLDEQTSQLKTGQRYKGDGNDRFTFSENNVFSPWSAYGAYNFAGTTTTTIGLEITGTSGTNINVKFYTTNPENGPPSKPQDIHVASSAGHPRSTWAQMLEPDVISPGGNILVERRTRPLYQPWSSWSQIVSLPGNATDYTDNSIQQGCTGNCPDSVQYRIRASDDTGKLSVYSDIASMTYYFYKAGGETSAKPDKFELFDANPNPFNPTTNIKFQIPGDAHVTLRVFNTLGQEVATLANGFQSAGSYSVPFDASQLSSGVYIYTLKAGNYTASKKLLLLK